MFCCHVYVDMLYWHVYVDMFLFTPATPENVCLTYITCMTREKFTPTKPSETLTLNKNLENFKLQQKYFFIQLEEENTIDG